MTEPHSSRGATGEPDAPQGLYPSPAAASVALKERYDYWSAQLTSSSFQLSVAIIGANWAVFGSSDKLLKSDWAVASMLIVLLGLAASLVSTQHISDSLYQRLVYAESDLVRWAKEYVETHGKADPWPYTEKINGAAKALRLIKTWLPLTSGVCLVVAIVRAVP